MQPYTISPLVICALGAALMTGCATPSLEQASAKGNVASGKVVSIETATAAAQPMTPSSSGSSTAGTTASSEPAIITVRFADGTQHQYVSEQHSPKNFGVGDSVYVITHGDSMTMASSSLK